MSSVKVAITLDRETLHRVDSLVSRSVFPNRSREIQAAVVEKLARMKRSRLASECAMLDPTFEKAMAEALLGALPQPQRIAEADRTTSLSDVVHVLQAQVAPCETHLEAR